MLDKETLLRQEDFPPDEESLETFLACLKRAKEVTESHEDLQSCIEKILEKVEDEE